MATWNDMNLAITQALASGMPVVATRHSGFPDQVEDGVSGFLVPEGNPQALAEKIVYLMEHPELWESFGRAGRKKAETQYDSKFLMDKQVALYQEVVAEHRKHDS